LFFWCYFCSVAEAGDTVVGAASIVNGSNTVPHLTQVHATHHTAEIGQDPISAPLKNLARFDSKEKTDEHEYEG